MLLAFSGNCELISASSLFEDAPVAAAFSSPFSCTDGGAGMLSLGVVMVVHRELDPLAAPFSEVNKGVDCCATELSLGSMALPES